MGLVRSPQTIGMVLLSFFAAITPDVGLQTDQLLDLRWDAAHIAIAVANLQPVIVAFDVAKLTHSLEKPDEKSVGLRLRSTKLNRNQRALGRSLRECRERARGNRRRAANQRDELAPPHSITSSASNCVE